MRLEKLSTLFKKKILLFAVSVLVVVAMLILPSKLVTKEAASITTYYSGAVYTADLSTLVQWPAFIPEQDQHYFENRDERGRIEVQAHHFPTELRTIAAYAFSFGTDVSSIELPYGVTIIEDYAFQGSMVRVEIPNTVTYIGNNNDYANFYYQNQKVEISEDGTVLLDE